MFWYQIFHNWRFRFLEIHKNSTMKDDGTFSFSKSSHFQIKDFLMTFSQFSDRKQEIQLMSNNNSEKFEQSRRWKYNSRFEFELRSTLSSTRRKINFDERIDYFLQKYLKIEHSKVFAGKKFHFRQFNETNEQEKHRLSVFANRETRIYFARKKKIFRVLPITINNSARNEKTQKLIKISWVESGCCHNEFLEEIPGRSEGWRARVSWSTSLFHISPLCEFIIKQQERCGDDESSTKSERMLTFGADDEHTNNKLLHSSFRMSASSWW